MSLGGDAALDVRLHPTVLTDASCDTCLQLIQKFIVNFLL